MPDVSTDVIELIRYLLPGFFAAWIFYGLTTHPRKTPFERVVEALIFTAITQIVVTFLRWYLLALGNKWPLGTWTATVEFAYSMLVALILGHITAFVANKDLYHSFCRDFPLFSKFGGITRKTSQPSQWVAAFEANDNKYVVLHLVGPNARRLYGLAEEWPDEPNSGHFVMCDASWLLVPGNQNIPLHHTERILIPAAEVEMVEFIRYQDDMIAEPDVVDKDDELLIDFRNNQEGIPNSEE